MVYFKIVKGKYREEKSIRNVIKYILNPQKNPHNICHAFDASYEDMERIINAFISVQEYYRNAKKKRIFHMIVSFSPDEHYSYDEYMHLGYKITNYFANDYQYIFALHENDGNGNPTQPHFHIALNPISYRTGKRLIITKKGLYAIHKHLKSIFPQFHPEEPF